MTMMKNSNIFRLSDYLFLLAIAISLAFSVSLWFFGEERAAIFVGIWVPSITGIAIYVKLMMWRQ